MLSAQSDFGGTLRRDNSSYNFSLIAASFSRAHTDCFHAEHLNVLVSSHPPLWADERSTSVSIFSAEGEIKKNNHQKAPLKKVHNGPRSELRCDNPVFQLSHLRVKGSCHSRLAFASMLLDSFVEYQPGADFLWAHSATGHRGASLSKSRPGRWRLIWGHILEAWRSQKPPWVKSYYHSKAISTGERVVPVGGLEMSWSL